MGLLAPVVAAFWSRRAVRHRRRGEFDAARRSAERATAARPGHFGGPLGEAVLALSDGRLEDAEAALARAAELAPENPAVALFQAVAALDAGRRADARAALAAAGARSGPNAVRDAYGALIDVCGDPEGSTPWPAALGPGLPGATHLRARVLLAAEARLRARESRERWGEGYLDAVFAE